MSEFDLSKFKSITAAEIKFRPGHLNLLHQAIILEEKLNANRREQWKQPNGFDDIIRRHLFEFQVMLGSLEHIERWIAKNEQEWLFEVLSNGTRFVEHRESKLMLLGKKLGLLKISIFFLREEFERHYGQKLEDIPHNLQDKRDLLELIRLKENLEQEISK